MTKPSSVTASVISIASARKQLRSAVEGVAPWDVRLGHGTSVFFDFGARELSEVSGTPDRGSDQLWIYSAGWRLFGSGGDDAGSGDEGAAMADALHQLVGCAVERARFDADLNLTLHFERGLTFRTLRLSTAEDAWTMFRGFTSYSLGGDGRFCREVRKAADR